MDSARSKLIAEASKTIKIDASKEFNRDTAPATRSAEPAAAKPADEPGQAPKAPEGTEAKLIALLVAPGSSSFAEHEEQAAKPAAQVAEPPPELAALAGKMKALEAAAKTDPYAVFQALEAAGMPYQTLLETFVSQKPGEHPSKATTTEANAALDALKADFEAYKAGAEKEKTDAQTRAEAAEQQAARETLARETQALITGDPKRWELCGKEPAAVPTAIVEARKVVKQLGRDVSDEEGKEIVEAALDALEEHYAELGARYSKAPPAPAPRRVSATISREFAGGRPAENGQPRRMDVNDARRACHRSREGNPRHLDVRLCDIKQGDEKHALFDQFYRIRFSRPALWFNSPGACSRPLASRTLTTSVDTTGWPHGTGCASMRRGASYTRNCEAILACIASSLNERGCATKTR